MRLPGMTAELAAAVIDWRDGDGEVSPGGAEAEHYLLLDDPHECKNAPFETVDEILLVKGASVDVLVGEDANRNGVLDDREDDAGESEPQDNRDGRLDRGLSAYLTVYSREPNASASGERRTNVNAPNTRDLSQLLRQAVPGDRYFQMMDRVRSRRPFDNIIEFYYALGMTYDEFGKIADRLTTSSDRTLVGRVNVNTAPRHVLLCLPELDESDADALIEARKKAEAGLESIAWVTRALPREKALAIGGHITTRSYASSADIVAVSRDGRSWRRYQAVIDTMADSPRVVLWKDLTHLGWPLDPRIIEAIRGGRAPDEVGS